MEIKKIQIKNFKSIKEITLEDVSPLMVLVGANGSGKSNFADAIKFFSLCLERGVEDAVRQAHGIDNILNELSESSPSFHAVIRHEDRLYDYSLEILLEKPITFKVKQEQLVIRDDADNIIFDSLPRQKKLENRINRTPPQNTENQLAKLLLGLLGGAVLGEMATGTNEKSKAAGGALLGLAFAAAITSPDNGNSKKQAQQLPQQGIDVAQSFFSGLSNIEIFRIDPFGIKNRRIPNTNPDFLNSDGSNIAAVLEKLEKDGALREQILDWLTLIVPEMENIETDTNRLDGSKSLVFKEESGQRFPAHMVSDGTVYALCILAAVLTRTKKLGITIIEEPERGLHPKAIHELIGFIREHARPEHPIILTTHSESVVRALELDELYLVSKESGATQIRSVKSTGVDKRQIPLDTAWLTNLFDGGLPW